MTPFAFYRQHALWLLACLLALLWLERYPQLDFTLQAWFYDPAIGHFPLQDAGWLEWLNHRLAKYLVLATGTVLAWQAWRQRDSRRLLTVAAMLLASGVVAWLKSESAHSCPWDLQAFGGSASWFPLFGQLTHAAGPGHCFPGGHASAGFSLLALAYWQWPLRPTLGRRLFWLGMAAGLLMGFGQMLRGAHFLSHNLWSGWLVWLSCCVLFACHDLLWQPWRQRSAVRRMLSVV